jgi:hypothetical protein
MRGCAIVVVAACASTSHPEAHAPVSAPVAAPAPMAASRAEPRALPPVRWANITTAENCFYFSGPFNGRDESLRGRAELEVDGTRAILRLGDAVFEGSLADETLSVRRTSTHEFEGAWTVTETIVGTVGAGELRASYRYEECGNQGCPGRCTMTADLSGPVLRAR